MRSIQDDGAALADRAELAESGSKARPTFRFTVALPLACALLTCLSAWGAMMLTRRLFSGSAPWGEPALYLWVLGSPVLAWLLGAGLARAVTGPLERILQRGQAMLRRERITLSHIKGVHEFEALRAVLDQVLMSFQQLIEAREVLDSLTEGIVVLDGEGRVAGMNRRGQELLGLSLADASGRPLAALLPPAKADGAVWAIAQEVLTKEEERVHEDVPFRLPSGREVLLSVTGTPLKRTGNGHGAVLVLKERGQVWNEYPEILGRNGRRVMLPERAAQRRPPSER